MYISVQTAEIYICMICYDYSEILYVLLHCRSYLLGIQICSDNMISFNKSHGNR